MLQFVKRSELIEQKIESEIPAKHNKHLKTFLDFMREGDGIPYEQLMEGITKVVGRKVTDLRQLSNGETRFCIKKLQERTWKRKVVGIYED